jgi:hypothetical protein
MKKCSTCKEEKPVFSFGKHNIRPDGLRISCKECESKRSKELRKKALESDYIGTRLKERAGNLKRMFGMSLEDYEQRATKQNNVCAICQKQCKSGKRLAVDHNHKTGKIRDLLCGNCNGGLGKFQDDPELLEKAAEYLRKHKDGA